MSAKDRKHRGGTVSHSRRRRVLMASKKPLDWSASPAQLQREIDAELYACPDGSACCDPTCIAENKRRSDALWGQR